MRYAAVTLLSENEENLKKMFNTKEEIFSIVWNKSKYKENKKSWCMKQRRRASIYVSKSTELAFPLYGRTSLKEGVADDQVVISNVEDVIRYMMRKLVEKYDCWE